jgi:hypothetical protein
LAGQQLLANHRSESWQDSGRTKAGQKQGETAAKKVGQDLAGKKKNAGIFETKPFSKIK